MKSAVAAALWLGVALYSLTGCAPKARKVFYVNSYHQGYPSSDQAMGAIGGLLKERGVDLRVFFLDAKRDPSAAGIARRAGEATAAIRAFQPDVLIVSDDDAVKYLVVPHFKNGPLPVVFCGVNWSAAQYGLPAEHVTGMLEVVPIEETLRDVIRRVPSVRKLRVLSEDSTSERNNTPLLDPKYRALGLEPSYALVENFDAWKSEFVRAQREADVIYLPTNGAIQGWDRNAAQGWVRNNIRKPVVSCDDFMMPYAVFGLTKVAREQGEWAARAALSILDGKKPSQIATVANQQVRCYWNQELGRKIGFSIPAERNCQIENPTQ
jgi:ABC-type uncharacterized transport system substrate-binding protein